MAWRPLSAWHRHRVWLVLMVGIVSPGLWAQALQPGDRVGVTLLGNRLWVCWRACGTIRESGPPAGTDGVVLSGADLCDRTPWWQIAYSNGQRGWSAERRMSRVQLLPLPGEGSYPNISAAGAYPVQVAPDGNPLNVRTGPGLNYGVITQKPAGATGWAYQVVIDSANRLVWWKIRWDDANGGHVGWSADSRLVSGVYLTKTGAARSIHALTLEASASGVGVTVSLRDLQGNPASGVANTPATLTYVSGSQMTLTAPETAPDGSEFLHWERNGTLYTASRSFTLSLTQSQTLRAVYRSREEQFLWSLIAPWRQGQYWTPSTYDGHGGGNLLNAVDFNRASSSRATCPYTGGWIQDCNEVLLASHAGRAYTRAQSGCAGYGNYIVLVSNVPVSGASNTYLATIYAHLNYFLVGNGTEVNGGQPIARLGSTGNSTGPHLHYEIREVTVSGSTLTLGARRQVLNNPAIRLSDQELRVDLSCTVSGLGYAGPPLLGTASIGSIPSNQTPPCTPYNCGGFLWSPDSPPGQCRETDELPTMIYLSDVDGDGCINDTDLLKVLAEMGSDLSHLSDRAADVNWDGVVDEADLLAVLFDWGNCAAP
ncbi:MAG: peptidoglycan DD-metalloendopeptidase family protein [Fimbriimonadales bacterium]|nr:peptidoglycan DD-metalloendopeptidase family protein [Fimbriimonadales bacterium]